jgi:hypothetical protein
MYKFRYSAWNSVLLLFLSTVCAGFIIFGFIYSSRDGYNHIEIISLCLIGIIFGGGLFATLFIINGFTAVTITINPNGIEKKTILGKSVFVEWQNIVEIKEEKVPDYLSGRLDGYRIIMLKDKKEAKIEIIKTKKVVEALKLFNPNKM